MKFLIVGLGNVGNEYAHTRHNIGFDVVNAFVQKHKGSFRADRLAFVSEIKLKGKTIVCICPSTFMNLSGKAVKYWMDKEKIAFENMLVIVDDIALPTDKLRLDPEAGTPGIMDLKACRRSWVHLIIPSSGLESVMITPRVINLILCLANGKKKKNLLRN
jgi:PTH1 family peptidyl-tRNA hydrolase